MTIKLTLPCDPSSDHIAQATLSAFLLRANLADTLDCQRALSEAVANCLKHAYPSKPGKIFVSMSLSERQLTLVIRDAGIGIKDVERARMPVFTTREKDCSGLGFTIMESFMDDLTVESQPGKGTKVTLKRKLNID